MALPNIITTICTKCKVSKNCPSNGSIPLVVSGKKMYMCELIGGYGRSPVEASILSTESSEIIKKNGDCVTFARIPKFDEDSGQVIYELTKIFHPAVLHEREKTNQWQDAVVPKNHR